MKIYSYAYSTLARAAGVRAAKSDNIVIAANQSAFIRVPFPYEGILERLRARQVAGSNVAYTIDVYESSLGLTTFGSAAHSIPAYAPLFEVVGRISTNSGAVARDNTDNIDATFRNADSGQTTPDRFIYVHLIPTSAAFETAWELFLECRSDVG